MNSVAFFFPLVPYRPCLPVLYVNGNTWIYSILSTFLIYFPFTIPIQAYRRVREYFQELYLLQLSMHNLFSRPPASETHESDPELAAALAEAINDPEIQHLLEHPDNRPGSASLPPGDGQVGTRKHSISSMALPPITAVTGLLEVHCIGCEGLLDVFPAPLLTVGCASGLRTRPSLINSPAEFSAKSEDRLGK